MKTTTFGELETQVKRLDCEIRLIVTAMAVASQQHCQNKVPQQTTFHLSTCDRFFSQQETQNHDVEGQIKDNVADSFDLIHLLDEM